MDLEEEEEEYKPLDNNWINEFEKIDKFNYPFGNNAGKLFALISLILWLKKNAIGCKLDSNLKFSDYI